MNNFQMGGLVTGQKEIPPLIDNCYKFTKEQINKMTNFEEMWKLVDLYEKIQILPSGNNLV